MIEEKIEQLLLEKFGEESYQDCFLVEINFSPARKLDIFIDSDSGITFEKCQRISRYLEHHIDEAGWLGEEYTIEVSSPGVSRPLKFLRQYRKNIGRKLDVFTGEEVPSTGVLREVADENITLEEIVTVKEGKKNVKLTVQTVIPFDTIKKAIVKVSFN